MIDVDFLSEFEEEEHFHLILKPSYDEGLIKGGQKKIKIESAK